MKNLKTKPSRDDRAEGVVVDATAVEEAASGPPVERADEDGDVEVQRAGRLAGGAA